MLYQLTDKISEAIYKAKMAALSIMFILTPYIEYCDYADCLCIPIYREVRNKGKDKRITMERICRK